MKKNDLNNIEIINSLGDDFTIDWGVDTINAPKVWNKTKGEGVKIAVIDTGIDMNHPDLKDRLVSSINMHTRTKDVTDYSGHGSMVAGLIAGRRTGVAPRSELYIAKVLDGNGYGRAVDILNGINFAIESKVDILCMSLGIPRELPLSIKKRISQAHREGIIIVSASGNSNINIVEFPASYDEVIAVGGIDKSLKRADFSNYGDGLDLVAPSVGILSTYKDGNYARLTGTSMASPLIVGSIALAISYYRNQGIKLNSTNVRDLFKKISERRTSDYGYGVMDLTKIIQVQ